MKRHAENNTEREEAVEALAVTPNGEDAERAGSANLKKDHDGASYALEATEPGQRPSRKSTRRSANRAKPDSSLRNTNTNQVRSPSSRHGMRGG